MAAYLSGKYRLSYDETYDQMKSLTLVGCGSVEEYFEMHRAYQTALRKFGPDNSHSDQEMRQCMIDGLPSEQNWQSACEFYFAILDATEPQDPNLEKFYAELLKQESKERTAARKEQANQRALSGASVCVCCNGSGFAVEERPLASVQVEGNTKDMKETGALV